MPDNNFVFDENIDVKKSKRATDLIIGLPAHYAHLATSADTPLNAARNMLVSGVPVLAIYPAYPEYGAGSEKLKSQTGIQLLHPNFELGRTKYKELLSGLADLKGLDESKCIYVCFLNTGAFTETIESSYSESMIESLFSGTGQMMKEVSAITGTSNIAEMSKQFSQNITANASGVTGFLEKGLGLLVRGGGQVAELGKNLLNRFSAGLGNAIVTGSDINFPKIWKSSDYSPTYTITVRLHNDNPANEDSHKKYIIEPLAKLLAFVIPISDSPITHRSSLMCSVVCPGLFKIKAGYISSVEIIKGGDENVISFRQRPSVVDIRVTFNDLYSTMVSSNIIESELIVYDVADPYRPTLKSYIDNLRSQTDINDYYSFSGVDNKNIVSTTNVNTINSPKSDPGAINRVDPASKGIVSGLTAGDIKSNPLQTTANDLSNISKLELTNFSLSDSLISSSNTTSNLTAAKAELDKAKSSLTVLSTEADVKEAQSHLETAKKLMDASNSSVQETNNSLLIASNNLQDIVNAPSYHTLPIDLGNINNINNTNISVLDIQTKETSTNIDKTNIELSKDFTQSGRLTLPESSRQEILSQINSISAGVNSQINISKDAYSMITTTNKNIEIDRKSIQNQLPDIYKKAES